MQKLMRGNNRRRYDIDDEGLAPRQQGDAPSMGKEPGYWQGGGKFGARDGIAGLLAAVGDGFTNWSGGNGNAVGLLTDNRMGAMAQMEAAQRNAAGAEQFRTAAAGMDYSGPEIAAMEANVPLRKEPELPPEARLVNWYSNATPEQRATLDAVRPIINNGPYGQSVVPRSAIMGGGERELTDEEIRKLRLPPMGPGRR